MKPAFAESFRKSIHILKCIYLTGFQRKKLLEISMYIPLQHLPTLHPVDSKPEAWGKVYSIFFFFFKSWVIKTELLKAALLKAFSLLSSLENPVYLQCLSLQSLCYLPSLSDFLAVSMSSSGSLLPAPLSSMLKQSMWTVSSLWFLLNASSSWYWSFKVFLLNSCF